MKHPLPLAALLWRGLFVIAWLTAGAWASTATAQADGCLFQRPVAWQALSVQWIGDCHDTYADGPGVLKVRADGPVQAFYGQLARGEAQTGVLEGPQGLQAGRMVNGELVPAKTKAEQSAAWRSGVEAARKTSTYFRSAGVQQAADAYAQAAERMAQRQNASAKR
ncbi:MAG: hypothetical protein V4739_10855 [Pseudomonadota bacterium]